MSNSKTCPEDIDHKNTGWLDLGLLLLTVGAILFGFLQGVIASSFFLPFLQNQVAYLSLFGLFSGMTIIGGVIVLRSRS